MNDLTFGSFMQAGVWCVIQITLLTLAALLILWPLSWLKRPVGSGPALSAIAMAGVLTLLCFAPLPKWWNALARGENTNNVSVEAVTTSPSDDTGESDTPRADLATQKLKRKADASIDWGLVFAKAMENSNLPAEEAKSIWTWRNAILGLAFTSLALGIASLIASLVGLRRLRRTSKTIESPSLHEGMDILRAQASCLTKVDVRESELVTGPATFGHFSPVILLPPSWRNWTQSQLSAVLAHELAHIQRGDYLTHLFGQLCLAVHFYHPLMHALVSRLRLDQELAADALAAKWAGPRENYLRALAEVALSLPPRGSGLAVRSFVPSRGAWVRRIEMLKSMRGEGGVGRPGWSVVWLCLMGIVALGVSTVRGPQGLTLAQEGAGAKPAATQPGNVGEFLTKYVPQNAEVIVAVRPGEVLAHPIAKIFMDAMAAEGGPLHMAKKAGIDVEKFEQLIASGSLATATDSTPRPQGVFVARYAEAGKIQTLLPKDKSVGIVESVALFEAPMPGVVWGEIDSKTIIIGSPLEVTKSLSATRVSALAARKSWEKVKSSPIAIIVKSEAIRSARKLESTKPGTPQAEFRDAFAAIEMAAPIWEDSDAMSLGIDLPGDVKANFHVESGSDTQAKDVSGTISAIATLGRNWLRSQLETNKQLEPAQIVLVELARDTLMNMKVLNEGSSTQATLVLADKGKIAAMLPGFLGSARKAAEQQASANNLKQIMLALHNYHDTYGKFPPAICYGPDGKTPHSWRVAILPFIEQDALYRQYKLDEPWDSENNKKVLAKVPAIFQDPSEKGKSTNTSYFAVAGPKTIINLGAVGAGMADITDGTSNTIAIVDAKKDIPWTKPEDLAIDTPAAMLGYQKETFLAGLGDGSVKGIKKTIDPAMLKWLFLRDDGNQVVYP